MRPTGREGSGRRGSAGRTAAPIRWFVGLLLALVAAPLLAILAAAPAAASGTDTLAQPPAPPGLPVSGTLRAQDGRLLSGVTVTASTPDGTVVTQTVSGPDGRWELAVPTAGSYTFAVDETTLPPDTQVLQGEVTRDIQPGRSSSVIFRFGEERSGLDTSQFTVALRLLVDGIRFGLVIAITAVGLSLIFGTTGLTNFAHGELVTIGAVVAWTINVVGGVPLIWATLLAILVGGLIGALNEWGIWRPLRRRGSGLIAQLVVSIGLAIAARYLILIFFSDRSEPFVGFTNQVARDYGPIALTDKDLATIIISLLVMIGIAVLLQRTRIGKAMRAVSDNRDLAASSGIDVDRVVLLVWVFGGGLATLGGVLFGLSELAGTVQWEMGFKLLLLMFAGTVLGGLGTAYGALLGCVIVGILVQLSTLVLPVDLKFIGGLAVLIVILIFRPQGLLGSRARIG